MRTARRAKWWVVVLLASLTTFVTPAARAHAVDAALLSLTEVAPGRFLIKWQAGSSTLERLTEPARFPAPCRIEGAFLECGASGLAGALEFPWLEGSLTHLVVDIQWRDDARVLRSVTAETPRLFVYGGAGRGVRPLLAVARDYGWLGVEHISGGFDHLLFVAALTLLVRVKRRLLAAVTAFTLGHSLSLAATALGALTLPVPPVEATIALSIAWVCAEGARPRDVLVARAPWVVAFVFGLLHGLGFASALLEIGLPARHLPLALLFFNVGVELGQLAVIGTLVVLGVAVARAGWSRAWQRLALFYAMGSVATAWSIERVVAVLAG
jgi:hydrogenase/urease accessory protein HupE